MTESRFRPLAGHLTAEVRSPVDRATTVPYSCFVDNCRLFFTVSTLLALFIAEDGEKTISAARERVTPEVKSPCDSLTRFDIGRLWNFSAIFHRSKVMRLFQFACKMPF
jgi:hypothetical protein